MTKLLSFVVVAALFTGCSTFRPITATSNKLGETVGTACAENILGFIPLSNDASIYRAAKTANIKEISTVDYETFIALVYNKQCTIVRGHAK